jgi:hypothetical protein
LPDTRPHGTAIKCHATGVGLIRSASSWTPGSSVQRRIIIAPLVFELDGRRLCASRTEPTGLVWCFCRLPTRDRWKQPRGAARGDSLEENADAVASLPRTGSAREHHRA